MYFYYTAPSVAQLILLISSTVNYEHVTCVAFFRLLLQTRLLVF
jgi:hypothetical protein